MQSRWIAALCAASLMLACTSSDPAPPIVAEVSAKPLAQTVAATPGTMPNPFANSSTTPPASYTGPTFQLSYKYPTKPAPPPKDGWPWSKVTNGKPINGSNAQAYVEAVKAFITPDMKQLLFSYPQWNAATAGWFNQPWEYSIREPIHGAYVGSTFPAQTLSPTQSVGITTFVLTYYNDVAAASLGRVWGTTAAMPNLLNNNAQFDEGSVIIKFAFVTATPQQWPDLTNTATWQMYADPSGNGNPANNQLFNASLMQFDIIVKDSVASPKTTWVYSTLVYDRAAPGSDAWARMIPLGAMWGNDPQVSDPTSPVGLQETWINPNAPPYSVATLGWGGRLSGPNDGAVVAPGYVNGTVATVAASSCMACHAAAEFPMESFLLPSPVTEQPDLQSPAPFVINNALVLYPPSSKPWMKWFQDRDGKTPMDSGTIALDYDMEYAFKSIPLWAQAVGKPLPVDMAMTRLFLTTEAKRRGVKYNGLP